MSKSKESLETILKLLYDKIKEREEMIYPSIDKILNQVGSKYLLVNIVAKRAQEMSEKSHYQLKESEYTSKKNIGRALEEVSRGLIHVTMD